MVRQAKLARVSWKDVLDNTWSGVIIKGDGTLNRIRRKGGKILRVDEV